MKEKTFQNITRKGNQHFLLFSQCFQTCRTNFLLYHGGQCTCQFFPVVFFFLILCTIFFPSHWLFPGSLDITVLCRAKNYKIAESLDGWSVVLRFNATLTAKVIIMAVGDAHVFPGFLTPALTQTLLQSHQLLFSHASAEVRGKNTPERNFA